jgi:hypothetical protein
MLIGIDEPKRYLVVNQLPIFSTFIMRLEQAYTHLNKGIERWLASYGLEVFTSVENHFVDTNFKLRAWFEQRGASPVRICYSEYCNQTKPWIVSGR